MTTIEVSMNGRPLRTPAATLAELLRHQGYAADAAVACAVNHEFVPRAQWPAHELDDGDRIDVVSPITGG